MSSLRFYSAYQRPKSVGEKFDFNYTWQYLDESGDLQNDSVNQCDQMQSVQTISPQEFVEQGLPVISNLGEEFYGDFTDIPNDYNGLIAYVERLRHDLETLKAEQGSEIGEVKQEAGEVKQEDTGSTGGTE